jgi:hypothetical protein
MSRSSQNGRTVRARDTVRAVILLVAATSGELRGADGAELLVCGVGPVEAAPARRPRSPLRAPVRSCTSAWPARKFEAPSFVIGSEAVSATRTTRGGSSFACPAPALVSGSEASGRARVSGTSARVGATGCEVGRGGYAVLRAAAAAFRQSRCACCERG